MSDRDTARAAKDELRARLTLLPEVTGIGIGRRQGEYVITVNVTTQAACEHVPAHVHGVVVEVRVSGHVRALSYTDRPADRPADRPVVVDGAQGSLPAGDPGCDGVPPG